MSQTAPAPSIEFTLPTMTCGHCVKTVTATVQRVDPDAVVSIDLPAHRLNIRTSHGKAAFAAALEEEGYTPA
jgi:copper chaperone